MAPVINLLTIPEFISLKTMIPTNITNTMGKIYPIHPKVPSITELSLSPIIPHTPKLLRKRTNATATAIHKSTSFTTFL